MSFMYKINKNTNKKIINLYNLKQTIKIRIIFLFKVKIIKYIL